MGDGGVPCAEVVDRKPKTAHPQPGQQGERRHRLADRTGLRHLYRHTGGIDSADGAKLREAVDKAAIRERGHRGVQRHARRACAKGRRQPVERAGKDGLGQSVDEPVLLRDLHKHHRRNQTACGTTPFGQRLDARQRPVRAGDDGLQPHRDLSRAKRIAQHGRRRAGRDRA